MKPASRPIYKAVTHPSKRGLAGQFALPGLVPDYVRKNGEVVRFDDAEAAENAALRAAFKVYESRTVDTRKASGYELLTGADFATLLAEADITPTEFAELGGWPQARVMKWLDGEADIMHCAHVLVRLLAFDENYAEARKMTARARRDSL